MDMIRNSKKFRYTALYGLLWVLLGSAFLPVYPLQAQEPVDQPLRVVTFSESPWVMKRGNIYSGFHVELWDAIAQEAGLPYEFVEVAIWGDMLEAVATGEADVAVQHHGVRAEREAVMDFTHEVFADGMQVVVSRDSLSPVSIFRAVMSPDILQIIGLALLTLLVVAHLIWVVERRHHNSEFPNDYRRGIFTALWWAILTAVGYGEVTSRYGLGRLVTLMWIFFTLFAVSTFTAQLATTFTINQLQGSIQDITDLRGKTVGTWDSGKQYDYLRSHDIAMRTAEQTDELIQMLQNGDVDALLLDVGNALFVVEDEANHFVLAGSAVSPGSIAFPLIADSPYREQINRALLTLRENGTYEAIYERYFGSYQ